MSSDRKEPEPVAGDDDGPKEEPVDAGPRLHLTELGNSRRFVAAFGKDLRFWVERGKWLHWNGRCWEVDETFEALRLAQRIPKLILDEAAATGAVFDVLHEQWAKRSESRSTVTAALELAKGHEDIPIRGASLDVDPFLLNAPNGTIDLRTGELRSHRRTDYLTRCVAVAYDPDAKCPRWDRFLKEALPDPEIRSFVTRAAGYSLTGDITEQKLFINHGTGANGKSTFSEVLNALLLDYAQVAPFSTFVVQEHGDRIPNDLAMLAGSRLVCAKETKEARYLDEQLIKNLAGGDTINARFLRQEFFRYKPAFKIWLFVNHLPFIEGSDYGTTRKIRVVPWSMRFVEHPRPGTDEKHADPNLLEELRHEFRGILAWAVAGAVAWKKGGLGTAQVIEEATEFYREQMDPVGEFLEEECVLGPDYQTVSSAIYDAHRQWRKRHGMDSMISDKALAPRFASHGLKLAKSNGHRLLKGVALLTGEKAKTAVTIVRETV